MADCDVRGFGGAGSLNVGGAGGVGFAAGFTFGLGRGSLLQPSIALSSDNQRPSCASMNSENDLNLIEVSMNARMIIRELQPCNTGTTLTGLGTTARN
jgi:hypothetical protein